MLDSAATWNKETTQFMPLKRCSLLETNKHTWNWEPNRSMLSETKLQSVGGKVDESGHVSSQILRQHRRKGEDLLPKRLHQQRWTPLPIHYNGCAYNLPPLLPHMIAPSPKHANDWPLLATLSMISPRLSDFNLFKVCYPCVLWG